MDHALCCTEATLGGDLMNQPSPRLALWGHTAPNIDAGNSNDPSEYSREMRLSLAGAFSMASSGTSDRDSRASFRGFLHDEARRFRDLVIRSFWRAHGGVDFFRAANVSRFFVDIQLSQKQSFATLYFDFETNFYDLRGRNSEIRRREVGVEVHRGEQGFSPDCHARRLV